MSYIQSNASSLPVNLYYEDWGTGKPVVFIHGWPLSHEMWEPQLTVLPDHGYRCIAYDRRGFGKSDKPWSGYDYTTLAGDLKAVLNELNLNNVTLVGFSMGGGEVVRYFSEYGGARVSRVVLVSSIAPYLLKANDNPEGVPKEMFAQLAKQIREDRADFLASFGKQFYGVSLVKHPVSQHLLQWNLMLAMKGSQKATLECLKSFSETDFRKEMGSITVPTLIIHGDEDKTVPIEPTSRQAATLIHQATYKVYAGSPHGLFFTEKERLNADLMDFIR